MQRLSRQSGLESRAVCLAAGWHRSGTDAAATVVSQAGCWGITQVTDRLIKTAQNACLSTAATGIRIVIVSATFHPSTTSTPTISSSASDSEIIAQLKRQLGATEQRLQYAELKICVLEERLRQQRIAKYGPGSEKLSNAQLELLELEPGVSRAEVEAESQRESPASSGKPRRKHPGRQSLPEDLPRVEKIVACTPEQCRCGGWNQEIEKKLHHD